VKCFPLDSSPLFIALSAACALSKDSTHTETPSQDQIPGSANSLMSQVTPSYLPLPCSLLSSLLEVRHALRTACLNVVSLFFRALLPPRHFRPVLAQILIDTRELQQEIRTLSETLGRLFSANDEAIFRVRIPLPPSLPPLHSSAFVVALLSGYTRSKQTIVRGF